MNSYLRPSFCFGTHLIGVSLSITKEKESARIEIPPLSYTFRSAGFINPETIQGKDRQISVDKAFESLSIDMVEVRDQEARGTRLPPFPRGQILDNWTIVELPVVFKLSNE